MPIPPELHTSRLYLRPWRADDAQSLLPILETNWEHLSPWIPARIATLAPVPQLAERLAGFGADFTAHREWRYGMFTRDGSRTLGEISLFPRAATGRVPFAHADRAEIGYWLRKDDTGRGYVSEGVRAVLDAAASVARFAHVEIRCDARNAASAAIPRRLGFVLAETIAESPATSNEPSVQLQVWIFTTTSPRNTLSAV